MPMRVKPIREPINQPLERRSSLKEDAIKESRKIYMENKENNRPEGVMKQDEGPPPPVYRL